MTEQWRALPGFGSRYEVSDLGRVRTRERIIPYVDGRRRRVPQRILATKIDSRGYLAVGLTNDSVKRVTCSIHVLVALAWLGPRPEGQQVCHSNGDRFDNRARNLRYDTPSGNAIDAVTHGTHHFGSKRSCPRGHPYDEANTYIYPRSGARACRTCRRLLNTPYVRNWRAAKRKASR